MCKIWPAVHTCLDLSINNSIIQINDVSSESSSVNTRCYLFNFIQRPSPGVIHHRAYSHWLAGESLRIRFCWKPRSQYDRNGKLNQSLLPSANEVWGKVMFSEGFVCLWGGDLCMMLLPVWLPGPMFLWGDTFTCCHDTHFYHPQTKFGAR